MTLTYWDLRVKQQHDKRKKEELEGLTGMDAEQADWEEGLEDEDEDADE